MNILYINPSHKCSINCRFCYCYNSNNLLDIQLVDNFLKDNSNKFDRIVISGGEPDQLNKNYFNELVDTIKKYKDTVYVYSYPVSTNNYREDVEYILAYDFLYRPYARESWLNIMEFKKKFTLSILLSPYIFKLHPNSIFQKIKLLPNLKAVEFVPFYSDMEIRFLEKNTKQFLEIIANSKLNVPYKILNKEETDIKYNYFFEPDGKLYKENIIDGHKRELDIILPEDINER